MGYEDRLDRADRLAANPLVGFMVDSIAKIETKVGDVIRGMKDGGGQPGTRVPSSRARSDSSPRAIAEALSDYFCYSLRPGQTFVSYGHRITVESSDDIIGSPIIVECGSRYYSIDVNVVATQVDIEEEYHER